MAAIHEDGRVEQSHEVIGFEWIEESQMGTPSQEMRKEKQRRGNDHSAVGKWA